jgi:hypothetical protein
VADARADQIIRDQGKLASDRGNFESQWEEIAERVIPRSSKSFFQRGNSSNDRTKGEKKTEKMLDSTAAVALDRYSSVMGSLLTPQNQKWHRLRASKPELNRIPRVLRWFDEVTDILFQYRYAPRANFHGQQSEVYTSVGAFGTGLNFIDWQTPTPTDRVGGLRYRNVHLGECYIRENHQGVVDSLYRRFPLTVRQIRRMVASGQFDFEPECSKKTEDRDLDKQFEFIHCVEPNNDYEGSRLDWRGKPWSGHYVCVDDRTLVSERGFTSFPYAVGRNVVSPGEVYGRSPAMLVLPNIKVLNAEKEVLLKIGHRMADPVLLAFDDGIIDNFSIRPGHMNAGGVNAAGQKLVQRLDDNVGQIPQVKDLMNDERMVINDAFLVTLFQILVETPQMTATEVLERTREKAMLLAPTMGRFQSESLGPQIERELDLLARNDRLPMMPPELVEAQGDYAVNYDSPLNRAMKAEEMSGFQRWVEGLVQASVATQDPSKLDWVDFDTSSPEMADGFAVPARWVRLKDDVDAIREGRNQQAQTQQLIDAAPAAASFAKVAADTRQ